MGYVQNKLLMVRPENGQGYDSFIMDQYFDLCIDGPTAPDDVTMAAIRAIKNIPAKVSYEQKHLVEAARAAYDKIATVAQQALVTNYADLVTAEQRIKALTPTDGEEPEQPQEEPTNIAPVVIGTLAVCALVVLVIVYRKKLMALLGKKNDEDQTSQETPTMETAADTADEGENDEKEDQ